MRQETSGQSAADTHVVALPRELFLVGLPVLSLIKIGLDRLGFPGTLLGTWTRHVVVNEAKHLALMAENTCFHSAAQTSACTEQVPYGVFGSVASRPCKVRWMASRASKVLVEVVQEPLKLEHYTDFVQDDGAGAIATFTGVTRDNFEGKRVVRLDYEAYAPMAEKKLQASNPLLAPWISLEAPLTARWLECLLCDNPFTLRLL